MIIFGSGCSGIESASVAWHPLGWRAAWFAENDAVPSAILAHRWPNVKNHGDFMGLRPKIERGEILAPDVFVAGTPCQSFSVAGWRQGFDDSRGQLTLEYVRIADAIDEKRKQQGKPATVCVWENVPGVLSDKKNAFGCFIAGLAGEDGELIPSGGKWSNAGVVIGPTRTVAWRILDAQYFGVAQRRRRVFVVASARTGFDPIQVLFEFEGVRRDSAPIRSAGKAVAAITASGVGIGGPDARHAEAGHLVPMLDVNLCGTLTAGFGKMGAPEIDAYTAIPMAGIIGMQVRRLTPTECERLQGFPDGYTLVPIGKKMTDDGPRYKALGNSKAVPVVRWIGQRIAQQIEGDGLFEDLNAKVDALMNQVGAGILFDTAQTLAWVRARDLPNAADFKMAAGMVERWQDKRKKLGLEPIK